MGFGVEGMGKELSGDGGDEEGGDGGQRMEGMGKELSREGDDDEGGAWEGGVWGRSSEEGGAGEGTVWGRRG